MARIDVICPTFNRSTAILPTIESVLAQSVEDWTLLVVSDGSTDDTDDVVRGIGDPRVRLLRVRRCGSPGGPRNAGLAAARAPYVAYLDHDDRWDPEHLAVLLGHLGPDAPLVATGCERVEPDGHSVDRSGLLDSVWHPELQALNAMYEPSRVGHVRELVAGGCRWSRQAVGFEDWDLWFRLAERGTDVTVAAERTALLTLHPGSRRHTFGARHGVGLALLDDAERAHRVRLRLSGPGLRAELEERYLTDMHGWFEALSASPRLIRPRWARVEDIMAALRDRVAAGSSGSFLSTLAVVAAPGGHALALPTGS
ncbi:MAG TPA: glycosyltransferase family 2 protein, partial [Pseudonocardiaceae bacterium]